MTLERKYTTLPHNIWCGVQLGCWECIKDQIRREVVVEVVVRHKIGLEWNGRLILHPLNHCVGVRIQDWRVYYGRRSTTYDENCNTSNAVLDDESMYICNTMANKVWNES